MQDAFSRSLTLIKAADGSSSEIGVEKPNATLAEVASTYLSLGRLSVCVQCICAMARSLPCCMRASKATATQ